MKKILALILVVFSFVATFAQHAGDSIDCSDRIGYSWMKGYGNANAESVSDVAVDNAGNIYVAGTFSETLSIDGHSVTSAGNTDFYVAKMSPDGNVVWLKSGGSNAVEQANAIAVDANGNVYVVGLSNDNTSFDGNAFPSRGAKDGFLLKLDSDGNYKYVRTLGCFEDDNASDLAIDGNNNVIVTGYFNYALQVGPLSFYQDARGGDDAFCLKFDPTGEILWSMTYASTSPDYGKRVACDASGNIYLAGEFKGNLSMGGNSLSSLSDYNIYLAKFNQSGAVQWAVQQGVTGRDSVNALSVSSAGDVYLAYKQGTGASVVAKFSNSGASQGIVSFPGSGSLAIGDIMCDLYNNYYVAGSFTGSLDFGSGAVASSGSGADYFIVRYGSDDVPNMQFYGNQTSYNSIKSLALDYANNVVAAGSFASSITINGDTETSNGQTDALVIKFERYISFGQINILNAGCNANSMGASIDIEGGEAPYSYYWSNGSTSESLTGVSAGTYSLTVVDNARCFITTSLTLSPPEPPVVALPSIPTLCPSDTVAVSVNEGMSLYAWNTGANTREISIYTPGTYSVTITAANSCTASASFNVSQYPNLDVLPETDYYFCPGEMLTIEASGFLSYYWSNGTNSSTFNTPLEYTFWVRAYNGICYYYDTLTTHKYPRPTIELGADTHFCEGDSVRVTAPDGFVSYSWSNGGEGRSIWVSTQGSLTVEATDNNSCKATDSMNVDAVDAPKVDLGRDSTYCTDGKVILSPSGSYDNCSFLWNNNASSSSIGVDRSGTYWLRVTNEYGCTGVDTVSILVINVPPFGLPDVLDFCDDYVRLSSSNHYLSYDWSTGETTASIDIYSSGSYTVTVTDASGCTISDNVNATKHYIEKPFFGDDTVFCGLQSRRLYLNTTYETYTWNNGSSEPYIDIANPGGYYSVSVTNASGCTASTSMRARFSDNYPEITKITSGKGLVIVEVEGGTPPYYYSADGRTWQSSNIFDNLPSDFYDIMVQDNNHCTDQMQTYLDASIGIPSFFTPNGDGFNDTWIITGLYMYPNAKVAVYDRYGKELFSSKGAICEWNGMYAGHPLASDSYWYVIYLGEGFPPMKGSVTIKR
ncbi:MAG: T9SS type B sorting domain-containing protein [Bacteroidales bacterium]|nr:T9SS type B sorting domain-containing protein [Bacteroidales bacterium]